MSNVWAIAKELKVAPKTLEEISKLPHTISYVLRKQMQIDSLNELPQEKRPPDTIIWWGTPEELNRWLNSVLGFNKQNLNNQIQILESEIE